ncbi:Rim20p [Sugiyamaella lignohabitans]|uniref:Rim20p n=1 Tax=Sugiyamaella lignohabitans TaxID=796027 RepID=A0A167D6K9_9ASCO|nr:Rim20p [Sugiyamaella lignohabitans]ANB12544.1 Rim20p [Sugiyamaella lignohabitans]
MTKFPSDIRLDFVWYSTLGYATNAANSYRSLQFERINVLYNIGAVYSRLGCKVPKTSHQDGLKHAYQYFQFAAGAFKYLINDVLPQFENAPPLALDNNTLESLLYLNLAQAQECFWLKAVNDGLKNIIIAKLASEVSELYAASLSYSNRSSILRTEWVEHIAFKKDHFNAAAQYRASMDCLDRGKYGEEVARLRVAVNSSASALKRKRYISPSVLADLQGLHTKAKSDLVRAEKDNDLIYLQDVVNDRDLPSIGRSSVSKPILPPGLADLPDPVPFASLLPHILYQTARAFQEKIEAYVQRHIVTEVESLNSKLHAEFQRLNLPGALDAVEKPLGVPQTLISYAEEIRSNGGLPRLEEAFQDIARISGECQRLIKEATDTLTVEESEDNTLRAEFGTKRWSRPTSKEAAPHIWKQLDAFKENLDIAAKIDEESTSKLTAVGSLLTVLSRGQPALEQFLPHATVVKLSPILEQAMGDLRAAISKCRGTELDRSQYLKVLQAEVNKVDLRKLYQKTLII